MRVKCPCYLVVHDFVHFVQTKIIVYKQGGGGGVGTAMTPPPPPTWYKNIENTIFTTLGNIPHEKVPAIDEMLHTLHLLIYHEVST